MKNFKHKSPSKTLNIFLNEVVNEHLLYFGEFYRPYLKYFYCLLKEELAKSNLDRLIFDPETIVQEQTIHVLADLQPMVLSTLIFELYSERDNGKLSGKDSRDRYFSYSKMLCDEAYHKSLQTKYASLFTLLNKRITFRVNYIKNILRHFSNEKGELARLFKIDTQKGITSLSMTDGDSHNKGKKVAIVSFGEKKIIYKPHSLSGDAVFSRALSFLNESKRIKLPLRHLVTLSKSDHGWQQYIEYAECLNQQEIRNCYYRIGVSSAIFLALKTRDVHFENLIINGEFPYFIDLETITGRSESFKFEDISDGLSGISEELANSVLSTILYPLNYVPSFFNFDLGGISGDGAFKSSKFFYALEITNEGTDQIKYQKSKEIAKRVTSNLVREKGDIQPVRDYLEEVIAGFEDGYKAICCAKGDFIERVFSEPFQTREVLRATAVYSRLLSASFHPARFTGQVSRKDFFEKLHSGSSAIKSCQESCEVEDLLNGDIPYFSTRSTDRALYGADKKINDYFSCSIRELVTERVEAMGSSDLIKQKYYIKLALSTQKNSQQKEPWRPEFSLQTIDDLCIYIADEIEKRICYDTRNKRGFLLLNSLDTGKPMYTAIDYSLYCGGGIILFFASMYYRFKKTEYKDVALALLNHAILVNSELVGAFGLAGPIGISYIAFLAAEILEMPQLKERAIQIVELTNLKLKTNRALVKNAKIDFISGLSGSVVLLYKLFGASGRSEYLELGEYLATILIEKMEQVYKLQPGLAHGLSGVLWALRLAELFNDMNNAQSESLLEKENQIIYEKSLSQNCVVSNLSWCKGLTGIVVSRTNLSNDNNLNNDAGSILAMNQIKLQLDDFDLSLDHSLCHGSIGTLLCVDRLLRLQKSSVMQEEEPYRSFKEKNIKDLLFKGVYFGHKDLLEDYSFMLGLSGIGYGLIALMMPEIPNILALDTELG